MIKGFTAAELAEIRLHDKFSKGGRKSVYAKQIYDLYNSDYEACEITVRHKESFKPYELASNVRSAINNEECFAENFYVVSIGKYRAVVVKNPAFIKKQRVENDGCGRCESVTIKGMTLDEVEVERAKNWSRTTTPEYAQKIIDLIDSDYEVLEITDNTCDGDVSKSRLYLNTREMIARNEYLNSRVYITAIGEHRLAIAKLPKAIKERQAMKGAQA